MVALLHQGAIQTIGILARLWLLIGWRRVVVTGLCLVAWRALEQIVVPGVNPSVIDQHLSLID